jgi:NAD(P)H-dependent flavin oxidoreductase YrpB (nitropropane dioxygenase family)
MIRNRLTERFGLALPIVSAPMALAAGGELAAAVSRAGGLGLIGGGYADAGWVEAAFAAAGDARTLLRFQKPDLTTASLFQTVPAFRDVNLIRCILEDGFSFRIVLLRIEPESPDAVPISIFIWLAEYWLERIFFQDPRANLTFMIAITIAISAVTLLITFNRKTKEFLVKSEEHEQPDQNPTSA